MDEIAEKLLEAPDSQLDDAAKGYIRKWDSPPKALQILEVLDICVHGALASGFVVQVLHVLLETACKEEDTTREELVKLAVWREA